MKRYFHLFSCLFLTGLIMLAFAPRASAHSSQFDYTTGPTLSSTDPNLACSPPGCALPNVAIAPGHIGHDSFLAVNPRNPRQFLASMFDDKCPNRTSAARSVDSGQTWTTSCVNPPSGQGYGALGVAFDLDNHAYVIGHAVANGVSMTFYQKSDDGGKTWNPAGAAVTPLWSNGYTEYSTLQVDANRSSRYANTVYISTAQILPGSLSAITVSRSTDGGKDWQMVTVDQAAMPEAVRLGQMAIGSDGTVYLTWMHCVTVSAWTGCNGSTAQMMFAKSSDGGKTWSNAVAVATVNLVHSTCIDFYGCVPGLWAEAPDAPVIAVDTSPGKFAGRLYVALYNWTGTYMQVLVTTSSDHGGTWSNPVPVAAPSVQSDQFIPRITVSEHGIVGVIWLDRRNDPAGETWLYQPFAAFSTNGGASFGENIPLGPLSSALKSGYVSGKSLGINLGTAWVGKTLYATWMDSSNSQFTQITIGGYRIA